MSELNLIFLRLYPVFYLGKDKDYLNTESSYIETLNNKIKDYHKVSALT